MCNSLRTTKLCIDMALAVATISAIAGTGFWFYMRGDQDPMLSISTTEVEHFCLNDETRFIRVEFTIKNIGNIPVPLNIGYFQINQILPLRGELERFYGNRKFRVQWPKIYGDSLNLSNIKIMPKEAHLEAIDFVISDENLTVETVGVVSQGSVDEDVDSRITDIWEAREIIDFGGVRCKK